MMTHWTTALLAKPWERDAVGPDAFDCWGIIKYAYRTQRGINLPAYIQVDTADRKAVIAFLDGLKDGSKHWPRLDDPEDFCLVALAKNDRFSHLGLYLDVDGGMVLHCMESTGVLLQSLAELRINGFKHIRFYRWQPSS